MGEFSVNLEDMSRRERLRVARVRNVLHALTAHTLHPNPSEHFTAPIVPVAPHNRWDSMGYIPDEFATDL